MTEDFKPHYLIPSAPPVKKGHVCSVCQKWFKKSSALRRHNSVHSKEKPISCDHCNLKFANKDRLYHHRKYLSLEKTYHCEFCKKSFKTFSCLKLHSQVHSEEKSFKCEMCNKYFRRKNALEYHYSSTTYLAHHKQFDEFKQFEYLLEKHKPNENYAHACTFCNKRFKLAKQLDLHVITHTDEKPYECDICGLKSRRIENILKHKSTVHSGSRELYSCEICKKSFLSKSSITLHKASVHENSKESFECKVCSRSYLRKSLLNKHMASHTGEKKYACVMCDKRYRNLSSLKYHTREHTGEKPYVCHICNTCFKGSVMLKNHSKKCKEKETTLEAKENVDSKLGLTLPEKNMDSKIGMSEPENENTDSKIGLGLPEKTSCQAVSNGPSAAKETSCEGDKVIMSKNIKFVKVQNAAELNFLRVTRLFQTYRYLSNVYSK